MKVCKLLEFKYLCHDGVDKLGDMILKNDSRRESFKKKLSFFCTQFKNYHKMYHKIRKAQVKPTEKYKRNLEN